MENVSLCPYKYIFGKPGEGVHSYRIFDIAVVDVVCTIILAYGISKYFDYNFKLVLLILFLLGIILHHLFCVRTTVDKLLFP
jgi:hypothetical protein